jgi:hypothetical protein
MSGISNPIIRFRMIGTYEWAMESDAPVPRILFKVLYVPLRAASGVCAL